MSLFFYLWGNGEYIFVFMISIICNYVLGKTIPSVQKGKILLALGIGINIGILFYFKYAYFFYRQLNAFLPSHFQLKIPIESNMFLPIGISFYTFMSISYLFDIYRKKMKQVALIHFVTYLTFFPHLVAGPIVRYDEIGKEIHKRKINWDMYFEGFVRFSFGLGKKVIIANNLAFVVDKIFSLPPSELSFLLAWIGAFSYAFQIYFDFSGYTDIAIGLAQFFGFHFPENFNMPYLSISIGAFWRRWHMSLSRWLKDYIYIPLGGSRKGIVRTIINTFIVFFLCGLWHGAAWTFILWGIYHGTLLVIERTVKNTFHFVPKSKLWVIPTFLLIVIGWVLFRAPTISYALRYIKTLFDFHEIGYISRFYKLTYYLPNNVIFSGLCALVLSFIQLPRSKNIFVLGTFALIVLVYSLSIVANTSFSPFIYFQF